MTFARSPIIAVIAVLTLAGCQHSGGYPGNRGTEKLLKAEDNAVVDGENDPLAAHMAARQQVDPADTSSRHRYTTTPTAEEINKGTDVRIVWLENEVAGLRSDLQKIVPQHKPAEPVAITQTATLPVATPAIQPQAAAAPPPTSSVMGVRVGEHPDKVRIVLDVSAPAKFSSDLDNQEKLLIIDLPQSGWTAGLQGSFSGNPVISGYTARPSAGGGVTLAVELKKAAKLTMSSALEPNETYGHRIVFDVAPL